MKFRMSFLALLAACLLSGPASAKEWKDLQCGAEWAPVQGEAPVYPTRAQARGIEGYIVMNYTISTKGEVTNIAVEDASPGNAFTRVATRALQDMRFPPCMQDGVATQQSGLSIRYEFALVD